MQRLQILRCLTQSLERDKEVYEFQHVVDFCVVAQQDMCDLHFSFRLHLFLVAASRLSLVAASGGSSRVVASALVVDHRLSSVRAQLPCAPASSLTGDHTCVPCSSGQTLNHWTSRQFQLAFLSGCVKAFKGCFLMGQPVCCPEIPLLRRRASVSVCV